MCAGILIQVAQFEAGRIAERTRDALAARKAAGVVLGHPEQMDAATRDRILTE